MKRILSATAFAGMLLAASLTSCDMVYEDLPECHYGARLRFVYDHNMEFANAFHKQVDCLTVIVYDSDGKYVTTLTEQGEALADEEYRMEVNLPAGTYTFVSYGGLHCGESSFRFTEEPGSGSLHTDRGVELHPDNYHSTRATAQGEGTELHNLFYGAATVEVRDDYSAYDEATVYLMRDTNTLRVLLQQADGERLHADEFDFKVIADNTLMAHDNRVVLTGETTYWPWTTGDEEPGTLPDGDAVSVAWGEFSIPRIADSSQVANLKAGEAYAGPRLQVDWKADGRNVIDLPLIPYLLLTKPADSRFADMTDQEYLDRENTWSLFFFLDRHYHWVTLQISVKSWSVRINNVNLAD